jgi:ABC-type polysaccharide/polyol phosphate transport system ATPase subunit
VSNIKINNVVVEFPIHNPSSLTMQLQILSAIGGKISEHHKSTFVRALKIDNMEINDGDKIGIIGHNGAGKTTLLRLLSGVYAPSQGTVLIDGDVTSFTDLTLGMDLEATGLQNIIFRLVFMGLSFSEAHKMSPSIQDFSELGAFLHMPVRTYSTGMFLRLAFAISTAIDPDIVLMDEIIGAGDARFLEKAQMRLDELMNKLKILILASHDEHLMKRFCDKVIWLSHGEIIKFGGIDEVFMEYQSRQV